MARMDEKVLEESGAEVETGENPIPRYFALLFAGLVIWGVLFMGYFLLSGWSSEGEFAGRMAARQQQVEAAKPAGRAVAAADPAKVREEGAALFAQNCAACHGAGGEGGIGPSLKSPQFKYGRDPEAVRESIAKGRPGGMPGFGSQLPAAQVNALASYVTEVLGK